VWRISIVPGDGTFFGGAAEDKLWTGLLQRIDAGPVNERTGLVHFI
jgi:hypothetical protein